MKRVSAQMQRLAEEFIAKYPPPGTTPIEHLRHTVAAFAEASRDKDWVVIASGNIYGDGVTTGLTWGDLRAIHAQLDGAGIVARLRQYRERASDLNADYLAGLDAAIEIAAEMQGVQA